MQYSLSTDKATVSPYFGFSYMSSETEIKFFYLGLLDLNDENTSKLAKKFTVLFGIVRAEILEQGCVEKDWVRGRSH